MRGPSPWWGITHPPACRRAAGLTAIAAALLAAQAPLAQAVAEDRPAPLLEIQGSVTVPSSYVVVLKNGSNGQAMVRRHGLRPSHVYSASLDGFAAGLDSEQLARVRRDRSVAYVIPDALVSAAAKPVPKDPSRNIGPQRDAAGPKPTGWIPGGSVQHHAPWGLDRIDQLGTVLDGLYHHASTGKGVTAYVLDTGIARSHDEIAGRVIGGYTVIDDGNGSEDCMGHGTHIAGVIAGRTFGVAKEASLVSVRVLGCDALGTYAGVIAGVDWVTNHHKGPSVANMSLVGGWHKALNDAVIRSIKKGVTYVLAAGNTGEDACALSPTSVSAALTVGAIDWTDTRPAWSNTGPCVDLFAPGESITSAWIGGTSRFESLSGTSMAAPHVAGLAALYLQANPRATPAQVETALIATAASNTVKNAETTAKRLARKWNGGFPNAGAIRMEPDGKFWHQAQGGQIEIWLVGVAGTDVDLYLQRWEATAWNVVARSTADSAVERITYDSSPGYYRVMVHAYRGVQPYDLWSIHPR